MRDLSILIPARCEIFLRNTVEDILKNIEADTEIIVTLDGEWAEPGLVQNERVNVIYVPEAVGQRGATDLAFRLSKGKYIAKCDAHVAFDKGFDRKMLAAFEEAGDKATILPVMRNLWVYDWKCYKCGKRIYQDKVPICPDCGNKMKKKMLWIGKKRPQSTSYCFDSDPKFTYFEDWKHRPKYIKDKEETGLTESMSIQGSFYMMPRERFAQFSEGRVELGSWGNEGIEIALKTRLSGGRVLVNHKTWYAHLFRTKSGVFGFPWPVSGRLQRDTKKNVKDLFWDGKWHKQIYPVSKVVEQFMPVPGWDEKSLADLKAHEAKHPIKSAV